MKTFWLIHSVVFQLLGLSYNELTCIDLCDLSLELIKFFFSFQSWVSAWTLRGLGWLPTSGRRRQLQISTRTNVIGCLFVTSQKIVTESKPVTSILNAKSQGNERSQIAYEVTNNSYSWQSMLTLYLSIYYPIFNFFLLFFSFISMYLADRVEIRVIQILKFSLTFTMTT